MMLCATLVDQHVQPGYFSLLTHPTPPGVNNLKVWIEEAWQSGFDPEGAEGLKGKLVGHNKWIGTAGILFHKVGLPSLLITARTRIIRRIHSQRNSVPTRRLQYPRWQSDPFTRLD